MATQNLIQIKRSTNTSTPPSLANGELAWTSNGDVLYIGDLETVTPIAGKRFPGTLTANQSLVANSTSGIDKIIVGNVVPQFITSNGSLGSAGYVLTSGGSSSNVYWAAASAGSLSGLSDTNITTPGDGAILFYDNGTSRWIDNVVSGDATIADSGVLTLATVNDDAGTLGDANTVPQITIDAKGRITNAAAVDINHDTLLNFVSNEHVDHSSVTLTAGDGLTGGGDITTNRSFAVGAGDGITVNSNDVAVNPGDGSIISNSSGVYVNADAAGALLRTGGVMSGSINLNGAGDLILDADGDTYLTSPLDDFARFVVGGIIKFDITTTEVIVNNDILPSSDSNHSLGNNNLFWSEAYIDDLIISSSIEANGTIGTDGQVLKSNGSIAYWDDGASGTVTSIATGNGITGGTITDSGTIYADGANGISVTSAGINVQVGNNQLVSNTTGIWIAETNINHDNLSGFVSNEHINHSSVTLTAGNGLTGGGDITTNRSFAVVGGTGVTSNSTGVHIGQAVGTTDNVTFNDVTISGNLDINGTLTTIDTTNMSVSDSLISLARGNDTADTLDIGFYGLFDTTGSQDLYAGLFRDASDGKFKLFTGLQSEPSTTVNIAGTGYSVATLVAALESSDVTITGGSITGITDLDVTDGGTGVSTFANNGILYGQNTDPVAVATGSTYEVLQLNASGVPVFAGLDGGTF